MAIPNLLTAWKCMADDEERSLTFKLGNIRSSRCLLLIFETTEMGEEKIKRYFRSFTTIY